MKQVKSHLLNQTQKRKVKKKNLHKKKKIEWNRRDYKKNKSSKKE